MMPSRASPFAELEHDPEAFHFRPGLKNTALRLIGRGKIADECDGFDVPVRNSRDIAFHGEQFPPRQVVEKKRD